MKRIDLDEMERAAKSDYVQIPGRDVAVIVRALRAASVIWLGSTERWSNVAQTICYEMGALMSREPIDEFNSAIEPFRKEAT